MRNISVRRATLAIGSLWVYFSVAILLGETIAGFHLHLGYVSLICIVGLVGIELSIRTLYKAQVLSLSHLPNIFLCGVAVFTTLIATDIVFSIYLNMNNSETWDKLSSRYIRESDSMRWPGEMYPRKFFPTKKNFALYKPNLKLETERYGDTYYFNLKQSSTVRNEVLTP